MLDLSNPHSDDIRAASKLLDQLIEFAHELSIASYERRCEIVLNSRLTITQLEELAREKFSEQKCIVALLAGFQTEMEQIAESAKLCKPGSTVEGDNCTICNTKIESYDPSCGYLPNCWVVYCDTCLRDFFSFLVRLRSVEEGFATELI